MYQSARANPNRFYIGIDANADPLRKLSEKAFRRPERGGTPNLMFVQAAAEALPAELDGLADEVHVHFPWGSLLRGVALPDPAMLAGIRRICAPDGVLEVIVGIDPARDQREFDRLGLPALTADTLAARVRPVYDSAGFRWLGDGLLPRDDWAKLECAWARRLGSGERRAVCYFVVAADDREHPANSPNCS
ncbi:MAG: hypothetical protein KF911_01540 [Pseudomonadales bacterium]|nr:hypothetical protein [Pseudomonadales bacterium]